MNLILLITIIVTGFVFFIELAKFDFKKPVHLVSMLCKMFGLCMIYGYLFEPRYITLLQFKIGLFIYLIGSSIWMLLGNRFNLSLKQEIQHLIKKLKDNKNECG